jgi:hypothetical protein
MGASPRTSSVAYYRDPRIRARLNEYLADEHGEISAVYVAGFDPLVQPYPTWSGALTVPPPEMTALTLRGHDIARSLWDRTALIFLLDLDYQNLDYPGEPFTHVTDTFFKLEKIYESCWRVFNELGLAPLVTATGRGYHFVGRVPFDQPVVEQLASLTSTPSWYDGHVQRCRPGVIASMSTWHARAAAGLGLVLEYLAQLILRDAEPASLVPVVLNGTPVGSGLIGRECVSIDISHAGDPLDVRHVRMAFSTYQFHRARPDIFGPAIANSPVIVAMPREQRSLEAFLRAGRGLANGLEASTTARSALPDISRGVTTLLERYAQSPLGQFHATFNRESDAMLDEPWPEIPDDVPPCIRRPLDQPNDLLLKPEYLQNLVRGLMARDWSAAAIARLVEREYARDHHWSDHWQRLDARTRAEFDVRVFAGLIVTGVDRLIDFNCMSSQEKGVCPRCGCAHDLREDRDRLMTKFGS